MRYFVLSGLILFFGVLACDSEEPFHREIIIGYGDTVSLDSEDLSLSFAAINDSRCPLRVTCVWAGEARVTLKVSKDSAEETLELKTRGLCQDESGPCGEEKELFGYRFKLLFVYPYPEEGVSIEPDDYLVKLVVVKI